MTDAPVISATHNERGEGDDRSDEEGSGGGTEGTRADIIVLSF